MRNQVTDHETGHLEGAASAQPPSERRRLTWLTQWKKFFPKIPRSLLLKPRKTAVEKKVS